MAHVFCVGHAVEDHVFLVDEMPRTARKHQASSMNVVGGGPAASAAVAVARLGGKASLASRVGDDETGSSIIRNLEHEGVDCQHVRRFCGVTSSTSAVLVDKDGERMIVNYRPDDLPTQPDWISARFPDDTDAVLADVRWPEGAAIALEIARERGIPGVLDADLRVPKDGRLLQLAHIAAFSADGLIDYAGLDDLQSALLKVSKETDAYCAVTCGSHGVLCAENGAILKIPAYDTQVVDTLGAGDIWHGAFALGLAEGQAIHDAMRFANASAAIKVTRPGGRDGAPTREEVESFTRKHSPKEAAS